MNDKVQQKLDELFKLYSKNLPGKIQNIEALWKEQQLHWDFTKFQDFHREVHSLCGSAGTYGYAELSKAARQMEVFLKSILNDELLTPENQEKITIYLNHLKSVLALELPKTLPTLETKSSKPIENKCVFIMEQDKVIIQQLSESLKQAGYRLFPIQDMITLRMAVKEEPPTALIINTNFLDKTGIQLILDFQKEQPSPIPLFCILPNAELLPRLEAIRAGCQAFFQKPLDVPQLTQILNYKCSITPGEPYRILIIDDSEPLAEYYSLILNQAGMTARAITNPMNLLIELEQFQPNLLLMDVYMPECTGFELAAVLRQESNYTKIPIIFLSTEDNKDKKLFAISLGGDDFLTKPISPQHLISAVRSRSKRASILNYYMTTDSLTGLLNHSSILKQLDIQIAQARLTKQALSFIMIDIDHFKKVNDTYGHPVGDVVIKKLSSLLLSRLRSQDCVGRYGGEEFAVILPGAKIEDAKKIANDLRIQFSQYCFKANRSKTTPLEENAINFNITLSAGISCLNDANDGPRIIEEADQALYKAKQLGRNQVVAVDQNS